MKQNFKYGFRSYLKDVFLELPKYRFNHNPVEGSDLESKKETQEIFLGREKITEKFLNILKNGTTNGSYLITGYRGMGKTSFVKRVLTKYEEFRKTNPRTKWTYKNPVKVINISFAQTDLNDKDILKQITNKLIDFAEENNFVKLKPVIAFQKIILYTFLTLLTFVILIYSKKRIYNFFELYIKSRDFVKSIESVIPTLRELFPAISDFNLEREVGILFVFLIFSILIATVVEIVKIFIRSIAILPRANIRDIIHFFKSNIFIIIPIGVVLVWSLFFGSIVSINSNVIFWLIFLVIGGISILSRLTKFIFYVFEKYIREPFIYEKLQNLNERISASVSQETNFQGLMEKLPIGFTDKKTKVFPILNSKEIETELIRIFELYHSFRNYKIDFIIVFDELDKVEPNLGKGFYNEADDTSGGDRFSKSRIDSLRIRKEMIIGILSSLKYFVTEAKSKFIFIAGREMFDASLADIADRESFISSIFHQIIYVDSFLKDAASPYSGGNSLSSMAEYYLSHILMPDFEGVRSNFLKEYYQHLWQNRLIYNHKCLTDSEYNEELLKIIYTLQSFIIFLSYRSNGSPKKMVRLIEEYILGGNDTRLKKMEEHDVYIAEKVESTNLFLTFTYRNQYHFGFITYLYQPFLMGQSLILKEFSDNILVATPYLMDHVIKYHPFAFSLQNLELIPEILTQNRNPLYRYFIDELVDYLNINHLRETEMGLYDYKFISRTTNEIAYVSKIFEEELAAFNFSLDEMFQIKYHLKDKIKTLRTNYGKTEESIRDQFIRSLSFLNGLLGDSYYFDQEYDSAIVAYMDGIHNLKLDGNLGLEVSIINIVLKLKLGLVYEKMKNYEHALGYYGDCLKDLSVCTSIYVSHDEKSKKDKFFKTTNSKERKNGEIIKLYNLVLSASLCIKEKYLYVGIKSEDIENHIYQFSKLFPDSSNKSKNQKQEFNIVKADFFNNIGNLLFYKNFLPHRISPSKCPNFISKILIDSDPSLEFDGMKPELYTNKKKDEQFSYEAIKFYKKSLIEIFGYGSEKEKPLMELIKTASKGLFGNTISFHKNRLKIIGFTLSCIGDGILSGINFEINDNLDTLIRDNYKTESLEKKKIWDLQTQAYFETEAYKFVQGDTLVFLVYTYYLSARYYSKAGIQTSFAIQLKKMFFILYQFHSKVQISKPLLDYLQETILAMILEANSWNSDSTDRPQIYRYKNIISEIDGLPHPKKYTKYNYQNISNNPDTREAVILFAKLKISSQGYSYNWDQPLRDIQTSLPELALINPNNSISCQMTRMLELELQIRINSHILSNRFKSFADWTKGPFKYYKRQKVEIGNLKYERVEAGNENEDFLMFIQNKIIPNLGTEILIDLKELVINSIHSLIELLQIMEVYGATPYLSNYLFGRTHELLGDWIKFYELSRLVDRLGGLGKDNENETKTILERMLGKGTMVAHDTTSHYQIALKYFHKAKEFHRNGKTYHKFLNNKLIFLEGGYEDELYHFGLSLERQALNSDRIRNQIRKLELEIRTSPLLQYENYANTDSI
jgi:Cdc6-like AAA superfamily ATPase